MRIVLGTIALLAACGPAGRENETVDAPGVVVDSPATPAVSRVYAHSGSVLYAMDPATLAASPIGTMTGLEMNRSLLDLAVDKTSGIVGITRDTLYRIDASTGAATIIKDLSTAAQGFTSLSYAPMNPMDQNSAEILVSANDQGNVYRIDIAGAQATPTMIGTFGTRSGDKIVSSGDLIGVHGYGVFATVNVGAETNDYLAKIDPTNGWSATVLPSSTGYDKIFGLGFWGGRIYGFVDRGVDNNGVDLGGELIQIDPVTGTATSLSSSTVRWFGAGVTTSAPILL